MPGLAERAAAAALALLLQAPNGAAQPQYAPFESTVKGWSIDRPLHWGLLDDPGGPTLLIAPGEAAICGVHTAFRPPATDLQGFTDRFLSGTEQYLRLNHGLRSQLKARRSLRLSSGEAAIDVLVELHPGGRARRLFVLAADGRGHVLDCETSIELWSNHQAVFERVFRSFRLLRVPTATPYDSPGPP